jgi:hypothetical protein
MLVFAKCSVVIAIVQSRDHDRGHFLAIATAIKIEKKHDLDQVHRLKIARSDLQSVLSLINIFF